MLTRLLNLVIGRLLKFSERKSIEEKTRESKSNNDNDNPSNRNNTHSKISINNIRNSNKHNDLPKINKAHLDRNKN